MGESPNDPCSELTDLSDSDLGALTLASLDHLHEAISIVDQDLRLRVWNRRFIELLDFPPELVRVGLPFVELFRFNARRGEYGPGDPEAQVEERLRLAERFESRCFERTRPNGTVLEIRSEPVAGGGFITIYEDITARKRAETELRESHEQLEARVRERTAELLALNAQLAREIEERQRVAVALRESENRIRLITDAVPVLIGYLDADRRYRFVNQKYAEWFGVPAETFLGRAFGEMLEPALARRLLGHVDAALGGQSTHVEYELNTPVERRYVRTYFIPHAPRRLETAAETVVGCFVLDEDLTEYRQTQMALNQAQKLKAVGQLTGGVAHDFNNLLTIILGNLAMLEEGLRDNPDLYRSGHAAMNAARRGADLTRRLLAFSRQQTLQPRLLAPGQQLQEIAELLQRTLGASIALETVVDPAVWNIRVDPGQLTNAVLNLAINARDAMPGGGRLRIEAGNVTLDTVQAVHYPDVVPGDYVRLTVSDTGCGMTPEVVERAFEPFFTTKDLGVGTGLGLSMVYGFVKQSGGHVRIRSQVGVGTAMELYLPRHAPRDRETVAAAETALDESRLRGRETVLLVEDDPDIRYFMTRTLTGFGYGVREAANGRDALVLLAKMGSLDLLLSDMTMPGGVSGYDLVLEARRQRPKLRVLLMSGFTDGSGQLPADCALLEKPFQKLDLARAVRLVLDQPAPPLPADAGE
ncbi:MAG: PAS-domain containing protein [Candidatus Contendobacter sp.]|nr:PAS-domain containing protein [Candidatus Contendobacter sp.]MDG4557208.1 PAS-domain containing protein [Candidatus Contendobacter sp.]